MPAPTPDASLITTVCAALVADVKAAWEIPDENDLWTSAPELPVPTNTDRLPVAGIYLAPVSFDSRYSGAGEVGPVMRFSILGRFPKPDDADLLALKNEKAGALLPLLKPVNSLYHGCPLTGRDITYSPTPAEGDAARTFFEIRIDVVYNG